MNDSTAQPVAARSPRPQKAFLVGRSSGKLSRAFPLGQWARLARREEQRWAAWLVIFAALTLSLAVVLTIAESAKFEYDGRSGIVGWISVHRYPKQRDLLLYLVAVAGAPLLMGVGWVCWLAASGVLARLARAPASIALKQNAAALLWMVIVWPSLLHLQNDAWIKALIAGGCVLLTMAACLVYNAFRFRGESPRDDPESQAPADSVLPAPRRLPRRLRIASFVFSWVALPFFLYALAYREQTGEPFGLYRMNDLVDLYHEGEGLAPLNEMLCGRIPYRDIYLQHGLFQNALISWLGAKLFGPTLAGFRTMQGFVYPLGYVSFFFLGLAVFRTRWLGALALSAIMLSPLARPHPRFTFGVASVALVASAIGGPRSLALLAGAGIGKGCGGWKGWLMIAWKDGRRILAAGLLAALAFWHSVEIGMYAALAVGLFLLVLSVSQSEVAWWRRPLPLACFAAGWFAGFWVCGTYLLFHGALGDAFHNVYAQCAYQTPTWGLAFPSLRQIVNSLPRGGGLQDWDSPSFHNGLAWYAPIAAFIIAGAYLAYRAMAGGFYQSRSCIVLLLLTLTGAVFFRSALGRADSFHRLYGTVFLVFLSVFLLDCWVASVWDKVAEEGLPWWRRWSSALKLAWVLAPLWAIGAHINVTCMPAYWPEAALRDFLAPVKAAAQRQEAFNRAGAAPLPAQQAAHIQEVIAYIQSKTAPDEAVFDFSNQAAYLFFAGRLSATRYFMIDYASAPAMQREVINALERQHTRLVIHRLVKKEGFSSVDGIPTEQRVPLVAQYLEEKYEPAATVAGVEFYRRKEPE